MMNTAETIEAVREQIGAARRAGRQIGFVPTMGALHAGHISLMQAARTETDFVAVSIFVNPTQFGPTEDLARYPRPLARDLELCQKEDVDLVLHPSARVMYPEEYRTYVEVEGLQDVLCGASRPGHFRGVATVVLKLLQIVQPDVAYFGQKDAQQLRIIEQMVRDLNVPVKIRPCPIVREPDGLALSSRNQYLEPDQRRQATVLWQALADARALIDGGERDMAVIRQAITARVGSAPAANLDYAAIVNAETFEPIRRMEGAVLIALAVRFGSTRLIDNMQINVPQ